MSVTTEWGMRHWERGPPAAISQTAFFGGPNGVSALPRVLAQIGWQLARQHALVQAECVCVCSFAVTG